MLILGEKHSLLPVIDSEIAGLGGFDGSPFFQQIKCSHLSYAKCRFILNTGGRDIT
jgi:hypothetical protein